MAPSVDTTATEALRKARTALGWAVGASVGAGLALMGMFVALLIAGAGAADDVGFETLRGEVSALSDGEALTGNRLEEELVGALGDFGVDADVQCPDTPAVSVSTVVVCTGDVDGYVWTGVVVFEDSEGSFAVVEL